MSVDDEPADKEKIVQLEHHEEVPNDQEVLETKYAGTWRKRRPTKRYDSHSRGFLQRWADGLPQGLSGKPWSSARF